MRMLPVGFADEGQRYQASSLCSPKPCRHILAPSARTRESPVTESAMANAMAYLLPRPESDEKAGKPLKMRALEER